MKSALKYWGRFKNKALILKAFDLRTKGLNGINEMVEGIDFTKRPLYVSTSANVSNYLEWK